MLRIGIKCVFADVNVGGCSIYAVGEYLKDAPVAETRQKKNFMMYGSLCGLGATIKRTLFMAGVA